MTILMLIRTVFGVPLNDIFKLGASAAASEFCEWPQIGIDVYMSHHNIKSSLNLSLCLQLLLLLPELIEITFFNLYQNAHLLNLN